MSKEPQEGRQSSVHARLAGGKDRAGRSVAAACAAWTCRHSISGSTGRNATACILVKPGSFTTLISRAENKAKPHQVNMNSTGRDWRQRAGGTATPTLRVPPAPPAPLPPAAELGPAPSPLLRLPAEAQMAACRSRSSAQGSGQCCGAAHYNRKSVESYPVVQRPVRRSSRPAAWRRASSRRPWRPRAR